MDIIINIIKQIIIITLISTTIINTKISQIQEIREILNHVKDRKQPTFICCDLDETLIKSKSWLATSNGFQTVVNILTNSFKVQSENAMNLARQLYKHATINNDAKIIESESANIIEKLKKAGHAVIGLTARPPENPTIEATNKQLRNIRFSDFNKQLNNFTFNNNAKFSSGIIFCGNSNKGKCLKIFFQHLKIQPSKIIFIDDNIKYLQQLEDEFASKVKFLGLHFCKNIKTTFGLNDKQKNEIISQIKTILYLTA